MTGKLPHIRLAAICVALLVSSVAVSGTSGDDNVTPNPVSEKDGTQSATELSSDPLPWETAPENQPDFLRKPASSARTALNNLRISESELAFFFDRQPLDAGDQTLMKILFRFPQIGLDNMVRYSNENRDVDLNTVAKDPKKFFVKAFRISGRVKMIVKESLLEREAANYNFASYYRVVLDCKGLPNPVIVCARRVPDGWKIAKTLDEPTTCYGVFLKLDEAQTENSPLVFATDRMAWHPDRVDADKNIGADQLLLSQLGMDFGLFDDVRPTNGNKMLPGECFYQLLAAAKRISPDDLREKAKRRLTQRELASLLTEPGRHHGEIMMVEGIVRRIQRIEVDNKYFSERLGINEYYEIDMLMKLDQPLQISHQKRADGNDKKDSVAKSPVYNDTFPVVVCVRQLPNGLQPADDIKENIRVPAFFFKLWAYRSRLIDKHAAEVSEEQTTRRQRQKSPMFIGLVPHLAPSKELASTSYITFVAIAVFVLAIGGLWIGLWNASRRDDKYKRQRLHQQRQLNGGPFLNDTGGESQEKPV